MMNQAEFPKNKTRMLDLGKYKEEGKKLDMAMKQTE
jgi:hypothetical protein